MVLFFSHCDGRGVIWSQPLIRIIAVGWLKMGYGDDIVYVPVWWQIQAVGQPSNSFNYLEWSGKLLFKFLVCNSW